MLIACPSCQRQLNVPDNAAGKQVRCPAPDCGTAFFVPAAAPSAPVVAPPAPAPAVAFDFGGGAAIGPEADFGFTEHTDGGIAGIGVRTRINRAAGWLNMAAGSMVFYMLFAISIGIAAFAMTRAWPALVVGACTPFVILPFTILILVGARMLTRGRRRDLALTAAIVSVVAGGLSLIFMLVMLVFFVLALVRGAGSNAFVLLSSCGNLSLLTAMAFCGLMGGIVALRTLNRPDVREAFG